MPVHGSLAAGWIAITQDAHRFVIDFDLPVVRLDRKWIGASTHGSSICSSCHDDKKVSALVEEVFRTEGAGRNQHGSAGWYGRRISSVSVREVQPHAQRGQRDQYRLLGINPEDEFFTPDGRPVKIVNGGRVMEELL